MILVDEPLKATFRAKTECEACGRKLRYKPHVHHILSRGAGQVDIPSNLIALGGPWDCNCHGSSHDGNAPYTSELLAIAAKREGKTVEWIRLEVYRIRREPKK